MSIISLIISIISFGIVLWRFFYDYYKIPKNKKRTHYYLRILKELDLIEALILKRQKNTIEFENELSSKLKKIRFLITKSDNKNIYNTNFPKEYSVVSTYMIMLEKDPTDKKAFENFIFLSYKIDEIVSENTLHF